MTVALFSRTNHIRTYDFECLKEHTKALKAKLAYNFTSYLPLFSLFVDSFLERTECYIKKHGSRSSLVPTSGSMTFKKVKFPGFRDISSPAVKGLKLYFYWFKKTNNREIKKRLLLRIKNKS